MTTPSPVPAAEARSLILNGEVTHPLHFHGKLDLSGQKELTRLPDNLSGDTLIVSDTGLRELPEGLSVGELVACNLPLETVPANLKVKFRLTLDGCAHLHTLPADLKVGSLSLQDGLSLERLPEGLDVCFLNLSRCDAFAQWPAAARIRFGNLILRDCLSLRSLPDWLGPLAQLDISGCRGITALPAGLRLSGWLDVAGSGMTALEGDIPLRWRGVRVDKRTAFEPEAISGTEVMNQSNAEVRRVMMERMGYERFLAEVQAQILDEDTDAGGQRRLVCAELPDDEPFVAVSVACPSTGRRYVLRVPPTIQTAQAGSAWLAGFDDPGLYRPVMEA